MALDSRLHSICWEAITNNGKDGYKPSRWLAYCDIWHKANERLHGPLSYGSYGGIIKEEFEMLLTEVLGEK